MRTRALIELIALLMVAWISLASSEDGDEGGGGGGNENPTPPADTSPSQTACTANTDCPGFSPDDRCVAQQTCEQGVCVDLAAVDCSGVTGTVCQEAQCNPDNGQCYLAARADGSACDDGNACTQGDQCTGGLCVGPNPVQCDADEPCRTWSCSPAAGCQQTEVAGGTACDDGNACTQGDQCGGGTCNGTPLNCNDGEPCTADSCAPIEGCINTQLPSSAACDDGNPCTATDRCHPEGCMGQPQTGTECPGGPCTVPGTCQDGTCEPGPPLADGTDCEDGDLCTFETTCDGGECTGGEPVECWDDDNPCTAAATCAPSNGCLDPQPTPDLPCDSGAPCVSTGICSGVDCVPQTYLPNGTLCDDGNPCTSSTACDASGGCHGGSTLDGVGCDDGNVCTAADTCTQGFCSPGQAVQCTDGDPCTADSCHPVSGCEFVSLAGEPCDDGDGCTESDGCIEGEGCVGVPACEDDNPCTEDVCTAPGGQATCTHQHLSSSTPCDGVFGCNGMFCVAGQCTQIGVPNCSDANPCTQDSCDHESGCVNVPASEGSFCSSGDPCMVASCQAGTCVSVPKLCDDQDPCTADSCQGGDCVHEVAFGPGCPLEDDCTDLADDDADGKVDCGAPGCLVDEPACLPDRSVPDFVDFQGAVPGFGAVNAVGGGSVWAVDGTPGAIAPVSGAYTLNFNDGTAATPGDVTTLPALEARVTLCCWSTPPGATGQVFVSWLEYLDWSVPAIEMDRSIDFFEVVGFGTDQWIIDYGGGGGLPMQYQGYWRRQTLPVTMGGTFGFTLVVRYHSEDAFGTAGLGWFIDDLTVATTEICDNGVDDNGDGKDGCADPLCQQEPACTETVCTGGVDDDTDGFTDCADQDCAETAACL